MKSFFSTEGLARRSARHPWRVIAAWVTILVLAGIAGNFMNTTTEATFTNQPESVKGTNLIDERLDTQEEFSETVIVRSSTLTVDDPAFRERVEQIAGDLTAMPEVVTGRVHLLSGGRGRAAERGGVRLGRSDDDVHPGAAVRRSGERHRPR